MGLTLAPRTQERPSFIASAIAALGIFHFIGRDSNSTPHMGIPSNAHAEVLGSLRGHKVRRGYWSTPVARVRSCSRARPDKVGTSLLEVCTINCYRDRQDQRQARQEGRSHGRQPERAVLHDDREREGPVRDRGTARGQVLPLQLRPQEGMGRQEHLRRQAKPGKSANVAINLKKKAGSLRVALFTSGTAITKARNR